MLNRHCQVDTLARSVICSENRNIRAANNDCQLANMVSKDIVRVISRLRPWLANMKPIYTFAISDIKTCFNQSTLYEPEHDISNKVVYVTSKASDQPALTRSLVRAFASRLSIL